MYIYINFNDLSDDKQEEIKDIARDNVKNNTTQEDADDLQMQLDDLVEERIGHELLSMSYQGLFVFNI